MSSDQKARIKRILINAGIFAIATGASAFLTALQHADFGSWSGSLAVLIGVAIKALQTFIEPPQDVYR